ncbi:MAG: carboxylating nicotinate-nucleotide diphosphorylase [Candidatus Omnitrophota bacterium]|nr:carboxylating nicotinate-nucleotide diphosphorylase [Candidatus Omnitrophota bacterium]
MKKTIIKFALKEDIGQGDITTNTLVPKKNNVKARIFSNEQAVVCGITIVRQVFKTLDKTVKFNSFYKEGSFVKPGKTIIQIKGKARAILTGERVALNFLSHLSGIATQTARFVNKIKPYKAKILDTRKTLPGLRQLEKYAVKCGGGFNHRIGLWDMVLIKNNHKIALSPHYKIQELISLARKRTKNKRIEIEVGNLKEFKEALKAKPNIIMLDNMSLAQIKKAVNFLKLSHKKPDIKLEVSGNINLGNIREFAKTGVDFISVGSITHSVKAIDMSLRII